MKSVTLMLTTAAVVFTCGTIAATAQDAPVILTPGGSTMQQQQDQRQTIGQGLSHRPEDASRAGEPEEQDRTDREGSGGGMMGWHGRGMMGRDEGPGWMHHRGWGRREGGGPGMMGGIAPRIIFSLMDSDGDGKLSLDEFRAAHDRIFKAMDANKDGFVTMQEMMDFMRGTPRPASQP